MTEAVPTVQQDTDDLRITRWDFSVGAATGVHQHAWPYFVVMLQAGTLRIVDDGGSHEVPLAAGQAYARPAGIKHNVINAAPHPIAFIEIEVKRPEALQFTSVRSPSKSVAFDGD